MNHEAQPTGALSVRRLPAPPVRPPVFTVEDALRYGTPGGRGLRFQPASLRRMKEWQVANSDNFHRSLEAQAAAEDAARRGAGTMVGHLWLATIDRDGRMQDLGLAGCRVVTTAGVNFIVGAFQNLVELETMKYHGVGTGTTAEASSQTALVTELTTQYSVSGTRPTGSLGQQTGNANVFETAATITVSAAVALTEHGIFSQATTGGTLLDRTVFAAVNLASGESLAATYDFTLTAGG